MPEQVREVREPDHISDHISEPEQVREVREPRSGHRASAAYTQLPPSASLLSPSPACAPEGTHSRREGMASPGYGEEDWSETSSTTTRAPSESERALTTAPHRERASAHYGASISSERARRTPSGHFSDHISEQPSEQSSSMRPLAVRLPVGCDVSASALPNGSANDAAYLASAVRALAAHKVAEMRYASSHHGRASSAASSAFAVAN